MNPQKHLSWAKSWFVNHPMSAHRLHKHVSLIIHRNAVVSYGTNTLKTHPMAMRYGYKYGEVHSELAALIKIKGDFEGKKISLLNISFNRQGDIRMAKPCYKCLPWCTLVFKEIYYTDWDGKINKLNI